MSKLWRILPLTLAFAVAARARPETADIVLVNGRVFTGDPAMPVAEAVAIRGERILAVGSSNAIEALSGPATRRFALAGQRVVPGFNDAHFHFMPDPPGTTLKFATIEPSWEETKAAIRQAASQARPPTWIFGFVGHEVALNPSVTRFELDRLAPNHPVLLRSYYGHGYVMSSAAMPLLEIAEEEPDPAGGSYERVGGSRKVNGRLAEYAEWKPNRILANRATDEDIIDSLNAMAVEALSYGITSMQIMSSLSVDRFARLLVRAALPIRVRAIPFPMTTTRGRDLSEIRQLSKLTFPGSKVKVEGIKWILDGTPIERGAALRRPYDDRPGWTGKLNFPESEISRMVQESLDFGQPLLLHCAGDRSAEAVLAALESYGTRVDWPRKRVRIEHGDGLIDDLVRRARTLGVVVVQNPTHFSEPDFFHRRWGARMQPLRSLVQAGIPLAIGSDGPMNPFVNILFASTHPAHTNEAITREQAVRAYTAGSAFAEFAEEEKGTIAQGKLADLAVLSGDPFAAPPADLPKIRSLLTIVGGRVAYERK